MSGRGVRRPERHLVVMAKAPRLGQAKRRLAADIGAFAALAFYRAGLMRLLRRLKQPRRWRLWLYVTPDRAARAGWPPGLALRPQGRGDLGARMRRPLAALSPGPVVIVGSDIPALAPAHIAAAFAALGSHDLVFGPATDGGYWLVGARRRPLPPQLFRQVRWSSRDALADTLAGIAGRFSVARLATLEDVDDGASYRRAALRDAAFGGSSGRGQHEYT
ncbi:MAG TPA: TIGR04282 family arsenosugar biosynthesis glycosyltransferase [Alphaproteobacteria bacterium]|nr:TIGR04282 family arsenosugar biosynthesis glycosyltransferase [Alphaproteobacteria bacterium]